MKLTSQLMLFTPIWYCDTLYIAILRIFDIGQIIIQVKMKAFRYFADFLYDSADAFSSPG